MSITAEFCPEICLREFQTPNREPEECIPENLEANKVYDFLKKDQRNYWMYNDIALTETKGNGIVSGPKASVVLLEATHFVKDNKVFTSGKYQVMEVYNDDAIHFESCNKVANKKDGYYDYSDIG